MTYTKTSPHKILKHQVSREVIKTSRSVRKNPDWHINLSLELLSLRRLRHNALCPSEANLYGLLCPLIFSWVLTMRGTSEEEKDTGVKKFIPTECSLPDNCVLAVSLYQDQSSCQEAFSIHLLS